MIRTTKERKANITIMLNNIVRIAKKRGHIPQNCDWHLERYNSGYIIELLQKRPKRDVRLGLFSSRIFTPKELELYVLGYYEALSENHPESFTYFHQSVMREYIRGRDQIRDAVYMVLVNEGDLYRESLEPLYDELAKLEPDAIRAYAKRNPKRMSELRHAVSLYFTNKCRDSYDEYSKKFRDLVEDTHSHNELLNRSTFIAGVMDVVSDSVVRRAIKSAEEYAEQRNKMVSIAASAYDDFSEDELEAYAAELRAKEVRDE